VTITLQGRTAFITGGAQGIGLGIARALAARGVNLALADIDEAALAVTKAELSARIPTETYVLDVRDRNAFARVANQVTETLGPVSILCNNAGVSGAVPAAQMNYELWDWVMGINVTGVINGIQTFVPRMIEAGNGGHVVNTASGAGLVSAGSGFLYTTSKFAVVGLSESLRIELARHQIGVSVLCPGPVATNIIDNTERQRPVPVGAGAEQMTQALAIAKTYLAAGTPPDAVGDMVVAGILGDDLYIHTDAAVRELVQERMQTLLGSFDRSVKLNNT
jgi:NAD(P)-dependent dehydrogenase (short-subunit alcohol dehydrogenase family)